MDKVRQHWAKVQSVELPIFNEVLQMRDEIDEKEVTPSDESTGREE